MTTITITQKQGGDLSTDRQVSLWDQWRLPEIDDSAARTIAAWYQSPGRVGHVLATLASGLPVTWADLRADIAATMRTFDPDSRNVVELRALESWARSKVIA